MARITSFNPGQSPPQVTMPQARLEGSKNILFLGPAAFKCRRLRYRSRDNA